MSLSSPQPLSFLRRRTLGGLFALAALTAGLILPAVGIHAQNDTRSLHWTNWDVLIDNIDTTNNAFQVTETYQLAIDAGPFHGGFRNIPLDRITSIDNIQVYDNGTKLPVSQTPICPTSRPGVACYAIGGPGASGTLKPFQENITYTFRNTLNYGDTREIKIIYTVHGALRSYAGGDQLYWGALATDRSFDVQSARITVRMPDGVTPQKSVTYPQWPQEAAQTGLFIFDSPGDLGNSSQIEVRIQYPHNPAMQVPPWQTGYDFLANLSPVLTLISLIISGLILIGGGLFALLKMTAHRRGMAGVVVPEYLTEPPSDLSPGIADALIHLGTQTRDVLGTLLDLARRGYLVIEQGDQHGSFVLHRTEKAPDSDLLPYESLMLGNMFSAGETRRLDDLAQQFYSTTEQVQGQISTMLVQDGYCKQRPERVRLGWGALSFLCFALVFVAAGATYLLVGFNTALSPAITILPGIAFGLLGIFYWIVSGMMPSRTVKGEQEFAKWKAFRHYLENLKRYNSADGKPAAPSARQPPAQPISADDQFSKYIGYAIAFGVEKVWLHEITPTLSYFPPWYYPGYMYGGRPYRDYGYGYQSGYGYGGGGGFARPQMPNSGMNIAGGGGSFDLGRDLNQASAGLTQGLNSLNTGLTSLLNNASSSFTSHPPSSSGGGGGGFSGGGGGGGGSSGGGGAGFF